MKKTSSSNFTFLVSKFIYSLVIFFTLPIIFIIFLYKRKLNRSTLSEISIKFCGKFQNIKKYQFYRSSKVRIWIHAVSVGETHAAIPLIRELLLSTKDSKILLSNTTLSSFKFFNSVLREENFFENRVFHCFSPFDLNWAVKNFLNFVKPHVAIFIETEIWPNFVNQLKNRNVKIILANGRMSQKSSIKFEKFSWLSNPILNMFSLLLVQTSKDAFSFKKISSKAMPIITGNLKFDAIVSPLLVNMGYEWKRKISQKNIWLALSTREDEEEKIFEAWSKNRPDNSLLIVVPRHSERFEKVFFDAQKVGLAVHRRSDFFKSEENQNKELYPDVIVGNSMGEAPAYAYVADISLIGGSLLDCGGQSPIELCAQGCPVFFGPYMSNFSVISKELMTAKAGFQITTYDEWILRGKELIMDSKKINDSKNAAIKFVEMHKGASVNSVNEILKLNFLK